MHSIILIKLNITHPFFYHLLGHLEVVKLLMASGADVDCKDKKAYTPLHAAASSGMSSTVHYLLGLGVNVSMSLTCFLFSVISL